MKVDLSAIKAAAARRSSWRRAQHTATSRVRPSLFQYDYLHLHTLSSDVEELVADGIALISGGIEIALDVGSDLSPYSEMLARHGWKVQTLDLSPGPHVDHVGTVESTGLPDDAFDLVLCTQVIEHCVDPWAAVRELHRVVRPGGVLVWTAPQAWFYHPHPADNWRFTPEGAVTLSEQAGFEVVELRVQGGAVAALLQVLNFSAFGILGRFGGPLYAPVNVVGRVLDPLMFNPSFSLNVGCLCRK